MQWCSDYEYVEDLWRRRGEPLVGELNGLITTFRAQHPDRFMPFIAPTFGGRNARLLSLFQKPGAETVPSHVDADSHPNDPPAWEQEIPVGGHPTPAWGQQLADEILAANSYRRDGQWWCSTDLTGYPSWTADVVPA